MKNLDYESLKKELFDDIKLKLEQHKLDGKIFNYIVGSNYIGIQLTFSCRPVIELTLSVKR